MISSFDTAFYIILTLTYAYIISTLSYAYMMLIPILTHI